RRGPGAHGITRRGFRRTRPLLPCDDRPLARAAGVGGRPVCDARRLACGLRLRGRTAATRGARADGLPSSGRVPVTGAPTGVLSGPGGTLVAEGTHAAYRDVAAAQAALRRGTTPIIV